MKSKTKNAVLMSTTTVVGMTLVFVLQTVKENPILSTIVGITVGLVFLALGLTIAKSDPHRRRRAILEYTDSATVSPHSHIDIVFNPSRGIRNPRLTLDSQNHKVEVEEIWHNGVGTLLGKPRGLYFWHQGQSYPGLVDYYTSLIVRISNVSPRPAVVVSRLIGYREKV